MKRRLVGALAALALTAGACSSTPGGEDGTAEPQPAATCTPASDRTVVLATDRRPADLHPYREGPRITEWINQGLFEGLWGIDENHEFVLELLATEPEFEVHADESVTVTMTLRSGLRWSDGTPLTSEHVEGTWRLIMEAQGDGGGYVLDYGPRTGHELIHPDSWHHDPDGRTFSFLLVEPFGGIRNLFKYILPTHVLDSAGAANLALSSGRAGIDVLPASGPLLLEKFSDTESIVLVRNQRYHGSVMPGAANPGAPCVRGVEIRFPETPATLAEQLLDGTVDLVVAAPSRVLAELLVANPDVTVASANSLAVEHWGFNLHNPHLSDVRVRRAIATAIDKQAIIDGVYAPIHGAAAPPPLGSFFVLPSQVGYENHQADLGLGDAAAARALLEDAGYEATAQGGMRHPDRGLLELEVATTPDSVRQSQFELMRRQLSEAGIVVTIREEEGILEDVVFSEASLLCSRDGTSGTEGDIDQDGESATSNCDLWDIAQFTWSFPSPWPGGQIAQFTTGSTQNPYGLADESIDVQATACIGEMSVLDATDCFNRLDRELLAATGSPGVIMIPLAQRSTFIAWRAATMGSVPPFSDAPGAGVLARASELVATGAGPAPTPTPTPASSSSPQVP